jgi:hypothetical protein
MSNLENQFNRKFGLWENILILLGILMLMGLIKQEFGLLKK